MLPESTEGLKELFQCEHCAVYRSLKPKWDETVGFIFSYFGPNRSVYCASLSHLCNYLRKADGANDACDCVRTWAAFGERWRYV